jgi:HlyD family secretion protein
LIFKGEIDEAQAGKLKQGMDMNIVIGAFRIKLSREAYHDCS